MKKILAAAALAIGAASSFAAEPGTPYVGIDVGSTRVDGVPGREVSHGAFFGYNIHENFALEAGVRRLGAWETPGNRLKIHQTALSVIGSVPLGQRFSLYGRLGYNYLKLRTCTCGESIRGPLYGVGLRYAFSPAVAARVEVQRPSDDSSNASVGLAMLF